MDEALAELQADGGERRTARTHEPSARAGHHPAHETQPTIAEADATTDTVLDVSGQRIARVYAEALLNAAEKQGQADEVLGRARLAGPRRLPRPTRSSRTFLASGAIGRDRKAEVDPTRPSRAGPATLFLNFLLVLNDHDRLDLLRADRRRRYRELHDQRTGRLRVQVAVGRAAARRPARAARAASCASRSSLEPVLETRVDPDLLGGLVVASATGCTTLASAPAWRTSGTNSSREAVMRFKADEIVSVLHDGDRASTAPSSTPARSAGCWRSATASPASTACPASWPARWSSSPAPASRGLAFNLEENSVGVIILGDYLEDRRGRRGPHHRRSCCSVPVGEALIGRVVDPLGNPLDGKGADRHRR